MATKNTKLVHKYSERLYELKEATMYSSLKRLENDKHITSYWELKRKAAEGSITKLPRVVVSYIKLTSKTGTTQNRF